LTAFSKPQAEVRRTIEQTGCNFALASATASYFEDGGVGRVAVSAASDCPWEATSPVPWITIESGASGVGDGDVVFRVASNPGPQREAIATIAGLPHTITQDACDCCLLDGRVRVRVRW
jgi:hypothetical protein